MKVFPGVYKISLLELATDNSDYSQKRHCKPALSESKYITARHPAQ